MAVGDYISEIQTTDGSTHLIGSSVWVNAEEWNGKTITEVETEIKTKFSSITCYAKINITTSNLSNWVSGVSGTGTFTGDPSSSWPTGDSGVSTGWSSNVQQQ